MSVIRYNTNTGKFGFYKTMEEAGYAMPVFTSVEELERCPATTSEMVYFFNQITGEGVSRFSDKKSGARRIWRVIENGYNGELNTKERIVQEHTQEEQQASETPEADQGTQSPEEARKGRPGRKPGGSSFAGKTLTAVRPVNPRRAGTHGFKSYQIILAMPGISYEDYIKAGGRTQDLQWDINHGYVKAL